MYIRKFRFAACGLLLIVLISIFMACGRPVGAAGPSLLVSPITGGEGSAVSLNAILISEGKGISGKRIDFSLNGIPVGNAITDESGLASLTGVSLSGLSPGKYEKAVKAAWSGDDQVDACKGEANLIVIFPSVSEITSTGGVAAKMEPDVIFVPELTAVPLNADEPVRRGENGGQTRNLWTIEPSTYWTISIIILLVVIIGVVYWILKHIYLNR